MILDSKNVPRLIDHTMLKADASQQDIADLCRQAVEYGFYSVCVNPSYVELAARFLEGKGVKVCTVIGFPLGADLTRSKAVQSGLAIEQGASELDMVINIGDVKSRNYARVEQEIKDIRKTAEGCTLKIILETCYLTDEEKIILCKLAAEQGADFVKTSTGFGTGGATVQDIRLLRNTVGPDIGVKASGGIRDFETLAAMVEAGANRIGTSSGIKIMNQIAK